MNKCLYRKKSINECNHVLCHAQPMYLEVRPSDKEPNRNTPNGIYLVDDRVWFVEHEAGNCFSIRKENVKLVNVGEVKRESPSPEIMNLTGNE